MVKSNVAKSLILSEGELKLMKIIIAGCGKIGSTILASLVSEGHDVVAIDDDPAVINEITNIYDVMCVCGNCADYAVLDEADASKANLFVAVTGSDELNMLGCFIARKMGAKRTIARIRNPEYNDQSLGFMRQQLDLAMAINPEQQTARELFNILKLPSAAKIETFSRRSFEMIEMRIRPDSVVDGLQLGTLRQRFKAKFLVCAVQRGDEVFIPDGSFTLRSGDKIGVTAAPAEIQKLLKLIGVLKGRARNVMILGGSKTAYYLAKKLVGAGNTVKIIEKDLKRCEQLCEELPGAVVIHGDGAGQELLREEGLDQMDAFVALTGMDEQNILISIFAASRNVSKVIAKVNSPELSSMAEKLGLDCIISPREITSDILVQYARALQNSLGSNIETLYKLMDGKIEAIEFNAKGDSKINGVPLKDLELKPNILIAGIIRGRKTIIPAGDDYVLAGDKVVVIAGDQRLNDLSDVLK